jgi:hypothetical protein
MMRVTAVVVVGAAWRTPFPPLVKGGLGGVVSALPDTVKSKGQGDVPGAISYGWSNPIG